MGKSEFFWAKVVLLGQKKFYSDRSCSIRAKVVVFGQSCCNRVIVVVLGQKWFYSGKICCVLEKLMYLGKVVVFGQNWL